MSTIAFPIRLRSSAALFTTYPLRDVGLWRLAGKRIYPVHRFLRPQREKDMRLDQAKVGFERKL